MKRLTGQQWRWILLGIVTLSMMSAVPIVLNWIESYRMWSIVNDLRERGVSVDLSGEEDSAPSIVESIVNGYPPRVRHINADSTNVSDRDLKLISNFKNMPPQQNLWALSGCGNSPSWWYNATSDASNVRKP